MIRVFSFSIVGLVLLLVSNAGLSAQSCYYVSFSEKPLVRVFDLDEKAKHRRSKMGLPAYDWYDLPLNQGYVAEVTLRVDSVRQQLRWFNAVSVVATPEQMADVARLSFVSKVEPFGFDGQLTAAIPSDSGEPKIGRDTLLLRMQRAEMNLDRLRSRGLTGKGVRICVIDAGFAGLNKHPGLKHLFDNNQVKGAKDFFGRRKHPYYHAGHGTAVVGCIAGRKGDLWIGAAQDAEFLFARTENNYFEPKKEEDLWLAAMEWADREGADIISSSLGYTRPRYEQRDMDGWTSKASLAARIATRKGILVVSSQGNDGVGKFRVVNAPGDVDSVLTVGATYPMLPMRMKFSSFGPNARGQMKPDVCAPGYTLSTKRNGKWAEFPGTSFSTPLAAGFAACIIQMYPDKTNMEIHQAIRESGHLFPYYDYAHGYGVPDAASFFQSNSDSISATFAEDFQTSKDSIYLHFDPEKPGRTLDGKMHGRVLHYRVEEENGHVKGYNSILIKSKQKYYAFPRGIRKAGTVRIWFEGYLQTWPKLDGKE